MSFHLTLYVFLERGAHMSLTGLHMTGDCREIAAEIEDRVATRDVPDDFSCNAATAKTVPGEDEEVTTYGVVTEDGWWPDLK